MSLASGTRLGHYEILAPIGAGGMGEVYRARDTQLHRDVAIKRLPDLFAADPDRVMRFEREAQTLAALNHPNIAQVFGMVDLTPGGGHEGASVTKGLVMELVEGRGLDEMIPGLPLEEAVAIARQVAEGLEAAHERGIVHRDLKPANIRVRDDGTVKVLDFGLAKAADAGAQAIESSLTVTSPAMTQMGVILGTAAYMAPEQAKGKAVDKRADIWAFGCVLFEMLTGRTSFAHDSVAETLSAILSHDPDWTRLPAGTPAAVRLLLRRCLERDPRNRLRDIGEARIALGESAPKETPPVTSRRWSLLLAGALVAAFLVGAALAWFPWSRSADVSGAGGITLKQLTELPGPELHPDLSPDGRQVVFASAAAGNMDIYVLRVGGARPINLTAGSRADDQQPAFSPDGDRIAFRSERDGGGLYLMGATGESVRLVTREGFDPTWSPDGLSIAYATEPVSDPYARYSVSQLWTVEIASGKGMRLTEGDAVQPAWSPDGSRIAYWANARGQRDLWTVSARGGTPVAVTQDAATDWSPAWSPDGQWLYFASDRGGTMNIWRVPIDRQTGVPGGDPQPITSSLTPVAHVRFGADAQRAVVMAYGTTHELLRTRVGASGANADPVVIRSPSLGWCSPSPSADWLACTSRTAQEDIVLLRPDGAETIRLTDDIAKDRNPTWSPDGARIAFMSTRSGQWELWSVGRDGSDLRQMTDLQANLYETVWSPDGRRVLTVSTTPGKSGAWIFDAATLATQENSTFFASPLAPRFAAEFWSPNGRSVAGSILDPTGQPHQPAVWEVATGEIRTLEVPSPVNRFAFGVAGWFPNSSRFLFASGLGLAAVDADTGAWRPFPAPEDAIRYRLSRDGQTLHTERDILDADIWLMEWGR